MPAKILIAVVFLNSFAFGLPQAKKQCQGPAELEKTLRSNPSARNWAALGGWFGEKKDLDCAVDAFASAVRLDPSSAEYHYFLGLTLNSIERPADALPELQRSVELDGNRLQPRLLLGLVLNEMGRSGEAEEAWEAALRIDPRSVIALDWLAKARIASGNFDAAIDLLSSVPLDEELTLDLALAYSSSGRFEYAMATLNAALKTNPQDLRLTQALATVYVQTHRYQDATDLLRSALKEHPLDDRTELLYLQLLVMQADQTTAAPLAERYLAAHPGGFDALYLAGVVESDGGDYEKAIEHLNAAVALNPNHYDVRYNLGVALAHVGRQEEAREQFAKAVELDPTQAQAHFHLAQSLRALGRNEEAQSELKLFQQCQQNTVQTTLGQNKAGQASQAMKDGHPGQAAALYRDAIAAQPDKASYYYDLAMALGASGDGNGERAALTKAIELNPRFAVAENLLGTLEAQAGETPTAEKHFRAALDAMPHYAQAENNLGTLLASEGRDAEAEVYFRAAVSANPRFVEAWVNLAAVLGSQSRFEEARAAVAVALKIDPHDKGASNLSRLLNKASGSTSSPVSRSASPE